MSLSVSESADPYFGLLLDLSWLWVQQTLGVGVDLTLNVVMRADDAHMLLLDGVDWHADFVEALHMQIVEEFVLAQGFLEALGLLRVPQEVVRREILIGL